MKIYEYIVRIKDQASDKLRKLTATSASSASGLNGLQAGADKASASLGNLGSLAGLAARFLGPAALLTAVITLGTQMVSLAGDLEQTTVGFEVMLGSADKANKMVGDLREMAKKTPFETSDLVRATETMLGFGIAGEKVLPTLRMLGDVSRGNADKLRLVTLAYSQIQAAGRLMGQDLLQLVNAGFNPLQEISKKTGKSMAVLKKQMEDGGISSQMVTDAFISATSEGGRFFGMMDRQSKTMQGMASTLRDEWGMMLTDLGMKILPTVISGIKQLSSLLHDTTNRVDFSPLVQSFTDMYSTLKDVVFLFGDFFTKIGLNITQVKVLQTVFNLLAISMRVAFTPLRLLLTGFMLLVDVVKTTGNVLRGMGLTLAGVLTQNITLITEGAKLTADAFSNGFDKIKNQIVAFGSNELDAYKKIFTTGPKAETAGKEGLGSLAGLSSDGTLEGNGKLQNGLDKITSGGKQSVNVTINMENLIGTQKFDVTNVKDSVSDMEKQVTEALLRVLNSANYAMAQ